MSAKKKGSSTSSTRRREEAELDRIIHAARGATVETWTPKKEHSNYDLVQRIKNAQRKTT